MKTRTVSSRPTTRQPSLRARQNGVIRHRPQIRNILVPTDFSPASLQAVDEALPLLKWFGADLHLVHVSEPDYPLSNMAAIPLVLPESELRPRVERHLQRVAHKYSIQLGRENIHALKGRPFEEICQLARERGIDLIVMSTRGNTGFKHLALGSTAEHVVRYSPCPVLVMHPVEGKGGSRRTAQPKLSFERILVPIDFSECSMQGLVFARALAKRFGSKLILLNSVALQYYVTSDEYARYDLPQLMSRVERSARDQMRDLIDKTDWEGIEVTPSLQIGHAGQQICSEAIDHQADVIVTSTHGTTGFKHILVGSTAEYVVRHATCPVLVVPSHQRPGSSPSNGSR